MPQAERPELRLRLLPAGPDRQVPDGAGHFVLKGRSRGGFSLLEVTLVLCLLVVLAALIWPTLTRPLAAERLRQGAQQVRAAWTKARVDAISSGVPRLFRYAEETSECEVVAWGQADSSLSPDDTSGLAADSQSSSTSGVGTTGAVSPPSANSLAGRMYQLPEDVVFVLSQTQLDARAAQLEQLGVSEPLGPTPVYFYPDGTATSARVILRNEFDHFIQLDLRGSTGTVLVSDVLSAEELQ